MVSSFYGLILLGFTFGVVAVVTVQAIAFLWIIKRLRHSHNHSSHTQVLATSSTHQLDHQQSLHFASQKQVHSCFTKLKLAFPLSCLCMLWWNIEIEMLLKFLRGIESIMLLNVCVFCSAMTKIDLQNCFWFEVWSGVYWIDVYSINVKYI